MPASDPRVRELPLGPGVRIVKIDSNGLCALEKPAGVLSHPNKSSDGVRSLFNADFDDKEEVYRCGDGDEGRKVWLLNRLDSATSGLILVGLDQDLAEVIRQSFRDRQVHKVYQALVFGHSRISRQVWQDRMGVKGRQGVVRAGDSGNLQAVTDMRRIRLLPGPPAMSLLELTPKTGRTHQLRYQCGKRHLPIVGDQTYGNFQWNREFAKRNGSRRLFLHSGSVRLDYFFKGHRQIFKAESPLPDEFKAALQR